MVAEVNAKIGDDGLSRSRSRLRSGPVEMRRARTGQTFLPVGVIFADGICIEGMETSARTPTRWSLIVLAQGAGPEARAALGELIRRYESSVIALIRSRPHPPDLTPEELKQEFFARVLESDDIARLHPDRGHFRGWLRTAVCHFVLNDWDRWHSIKRGCAVTDSIAVDRAGGETPEHLYLSAFSWDTLLHALARLREESADKARFDALRRFLPGPQVDVEALAPIARSLGMTRTALAAATCRLRERLTDLLRDAVAETLDLDPSQPGAQEEIDREMALIYRALCDKPEG